jgi:hypothetical protein
LLKISTAKLWRSKIQVYTYSEARQKLALVLEQAENTGKVLIRRKDERTFALVPEKIASSPLDVPSIKVNITTQEIVDCSRRKRKVEQVTSADSQSAAAMGVRKSELSWLLLSSAFRTPDG